jgi:NAD+ diphosphatase
MSRSVFDRAGHRRANEQWLAEAWPRAQVLLLSSGSTTPVRADGRMDLRPSSAVDADSVRIFLGVVGEVPYFAALAEAEDGWAGPRQLGGTGDELELDLLVTAVALAQWHERHVRCPLCGTATEVAQAGWTRRCPKDGSQHFPRTDPAVIMLVHDGADHCLLGRGMQWPPGRFSTLAGFVEPGESLEAAVAREVLEEVAVVVTDVRYVASQPWPFPSSLMLGFTALAEVGGAVWPDTVEVAEAGWFTRDEISNAADWTDSDAEVVGDPGARLRGIPPHLSISRHLIDGWVSGDLPA